jgi:hypothetical protein
VEHKEFVGSLMVVSRELSRYRLDLVGVQEVRWEGQWHRNSRGIHIFLRKGE